MMLRPRACMSLMRLKAFRADAHHAPAQRLHSPTTQGLPQALQLFRIDDVGNPLNRIMAIPSPSAAKRQRPNGASQMSAGVPVEGFRV